MKNKYSKEEIHRASNVCLVHLASILGLTLESGGRRALHAKQNGGLYFFRDNNKYYQFSTDTSGGPIDFVMQFLNMEFKEAVAYLLETKSPEYHSVLQSVKECGQLVLPDKAPNFRRVAWYLIHVRGIDPEIVSCMMYEKKLYQQDKTGNCVFVAYDQNQTARYCSLRGCSPQHPFKQDKENSDKSYPFHLVGTSKTVYVFESPIDAMSHATLAKLAGRDWRSDHRISLGCLSDQALERFLNQHNIEKIIFCLDNDADAIFQDGRPAPNWGQQAAYRFVEKYAKMRYKASVEPPLYKDFNADLCAFRHLSEKQDPELEDDSLDR